MERIKNCKNAIEAKLVNLFTRKQSGVNAVVISVVLLAIGVAVAIAWKLGAGEIIADVVEKVKGQVSGFFGTTTPTT